MAPTEPRITAHDVTMAYGSFVIQHDLTFSIQPGEIFIIMGGSGCGKSTLLRRCQVSSDLPKGVIAPGM